MFTGVQLPVRQSWGWGRGEAHIPPAAPTPLTLPYTLLYICTVHELCSRTVGEYRLCVSLPAALPCTKKVDYKDIFMCTLRTVHCWLYPVTSVCVQVRLLARSMGLIREYRHFEDLDATSGF